MIDIINVMLQNGYDPKIESGWDGDWCVIDNKVTFGNPLNSDVKILSLSDIVNIGMEYLLINKKICSIHKNMCKGSPCSISPYDNGKCEYIEHRECIEQKYKKEIIDTNINKTMNILEIHGENSCIEYIKKLIITQEDW